MNIKNYSNSIVTFENSLVSFFDTYEHIGRCKDKFGQPYFFSTKIADDVYESKKFNGEFNIPFDNKRIQDNYNKTIKEEQAFAIVFCSMFDIKEDIYKLICMYRYRNLVLDILHANLCGLSYNDILTIVTNTDKTYQQKKSVLMQTEYSGEHVVLQNDKKLISHRENDLLICDKTNETFYISWD